MQNIIVTGGLGFIGSNFILRLLGKQNDIEITNIDAELPGSNHENLSQIKDSDRYNFVKGNISNKKLMEEEITKCDAVVNFAAESFVDRSIDDANPFLVSNIRGAFTILDIITKQKKRMIQISTDEVFGSAIFNDVNADNIPDVFIGGRNAQYYAIDGSNGNILWEFATDDEMFTSAAFGDANSDGEVDVFIGGRNGEFYAIEGQTGNMLWEFFPNPASQAVDSGWLNFYSPQIIPDQNGDLVADILVANGGDHAAFPWDTMRPPGRLMILDAVTGNIIAQDTMPDGEETYCSAICIDMANTGVYSIIKKHDISQISIRGNRSRAATLETISHLVGTISLLTR